MRFVFLRWLLALALLALLGGGVVAADPSRLRLRVGQPILWSPGYACMMIVCDDPTVVRVEDATTRLRITGLRVGATQCGFWRDKVFRRVISFTVVR